MKLFILALLIPCQIYCCQDCEEIIKCRIVETCDEMCPYFLYDTTSDPEFYYLYGKYEAYYECLHLIQHQGS